MSPRPSVLLRAASIACVWIAACAAASNPDRESLRPLERTSAGANPAASAPQAAESAAPSATGDGSSAALNSGAADPASANSAASNSAGAPQAAAGAAPAAQAPATQSPAAGAARNQPPKPSFLLGRVGGEPLEVAEFLRRLWIHDGSTSRDIVEQMVFARMVMFEASRLGIELAPKAVDSAVAKAVAALEKRLSDKGSKLTLDEHIERNLEVEPALYRASMRNDAIVSLLAERCVRAWEFESGLARVRISEFRERAKLDTALAELAAGKPFEAVAAAHGLGEDEQAGYTRVPVVRAESQELSRVAFATEIGAVGGPLEQSGAWLLFKIDSRDDGSDVRWSSDGERIEASLERDPLQNIEYVQWRAAMTRRYQLDLAPFLETVSGRRP